MNKEDKVVLIPILLVLVAWSAHIAGGLAPHFSNICKMIFACCSGIAGTMLVLYVGMVAEKIFGKTIQE